jgi:hypothetical protein
LESRSYRAREIHLPPDADDATLGAAVNEALSYSRELSLHDWYRSRDTFRRTATHYRDWRDGLVRRYSYTTQRALYINMLHVTLVRRAGQLECSPSNHVKIDAWSGDGIAPDAKVCVPEGGSAAAIGAALHLTLSRCLTHTAKRQSAIDDPRFDVTAQAGCRCAHGVS